MQLLIIQMVIQRLYILTEVTENNAKSIKYVAEKVQASDKFSGYSPEQQAIINKYIIEEISK
ncbi:MAG: hypothetical protein ACLUR5_19270 [Eubacterium ventriosum]